MDEQAPSTARLTASVEVIRGPADIEGIVLDLALRGEAKVLITPPPTPPPQITTPDQDPTDVPCPYSLSSLTTLRGGYWPPHPTPPQIPRY